MPKIDVLPLINEEDRDSVQTQRISQDVPYPFVGNDLSNPEKIKIIEQHFEKILMALGMDVNDDSIKRTPYRYAKMLVEELFQGLNPDSFPKITTQENNFQYKQMVIESHITINSICEHHFVPILGYCHVAYIPGQKIVGLSKLNRIAQYFSQRPQVQERLTIQIRECLAEVLETPDVIVVVDALHLCVRMRGIQDEDALTRTFDYSGAFEGAEKRNEFLSSIPKLSEIKL